MRGQFRVVKVGPRSVWSSTVYRWRMTCRRCGRRAHHLSWRRAMTHTLLHDCAPGSLW